MTPDEYITSRPRLSAATQRRIRHNVTRWTKYAGCPVEEASPEAYQQFRQQGLQAGLSPHSIEQTTYDVQLLSGVPRGECLPLPPPDPDVPTVERVGAIYRAAECVRWPGGMPWLRCAATQWWRSWLVVVGFCGLRLGDTFRVTAEQFRSGRYHASKPDKWHPFPSTGFLAGHVRALGVETGPLFGGTKSYKQIRGELARMAKTAGVEYVTPHGFRRFAVTQWMLTSPVAGQIIHGCGLPKRVLSHYVQTGAILNRYAMDVTIPLDWLTPKERADAIRAEDELLRHYRRASQDTRDALLRIARAV